MRSDGDTDFSLSFPLHSFPINYGGAKHPPLPMRLLAFFCLCQDEREFRIFRSSPPNILLIAQRKGAFCVAQTFSFKHPLSFSFFLLLPLLCIFTFSLIFSSFSLFSSMHPLFLYSSLPYFLSFFLFSPMHLLFPHTLSSSLTKHRWLMQKVP